jgi:hypothetical protein
MCGEYDYSPIWAIHKRSGVLRCAPDWTSPGSLELSYGEVAEVELIDFGCIARRGTGIAETAYNNDAIFACGGVCDVGGCMEICWWENRDRIAGRRSVV